MKQRKFKISRLFLFLSMVLLSTTIASAQKAQIKFSRTDLTAKEALSEIQAQTNYAIAYNGRLFDGSRLLNTSMDAQPLDGAMNQILHGTGFSYILSGTIISITKDEREPVHNVVMARESKPERSNAQPATPNVYRRAALSQQEVTPRVRREPAKTVAPEAPRDTLPVVEKVKPVMTSRYRNTEDYAINQGNLPRFALKTNLLYGIGTLTPNLAFEFALNHKQSLELFGSHNPWNRKGSLESNKKLVHSIARVEYRYWLCERFNGHFFGADAIFSRYNIGTYDVPMLFEKEYRYDGIAYGGGLVYGYHLPLSKRWGLEFSIGAGVLRLHYDKYDCAACNRQFTPEKKTYLGPTNAAINLVYLIK